MIESYDGRGCTGSNGRVKEEDHVVINDGLGRG